MLQNPLKDFSVKPVLGVGGGGGGGVGMNIRSFANKAVS